MIYRGYKIERGREGWDIYTRTGKHVQVTDNQTQALEWVDQEAEALRRDRDNRNAV